MDRGGDPYGVEGRKRIIGEYMDRFQLYRRAGRMDEALAQLRTASRLAGESVEHALEVAARLLSRIEDLCIERDRLEGGREGTEREGPRRDNRPG